MLNIPIILRTFQIILFFLFVKVNEAAQILHEYNSRLSAEMEDRKKLTTMLKDFQAEQRELLTQAEQRYKVCFKYKTNKQKSCFHYA